MLIPLLKKFLAPYKGAIAGLVTLQLVATAASLYLPSLNADIIDNGVTRGDTGYILTTGGWMLLVSLVQIVCSVAAVLIGAKAAMGAGRDLRGAILHRVGTFSAREVGQFGAPSLITRNTNDVQQVQLLIVMGFTIVVMAPIMCIGGVVMALREDIGLSWILLIAVPGLAIAMGLIVARMVPGFRAMQVRIDAVNRVLREQITGIRVVRAFVRERKEIDRFGVANDSLTAAALHVGRLMALMFPTVMLISNVTSVAVIWFGGHAINNGTMEIGALTALLSYIMLILMSVMMASFIAMMVPRASVCADRISQVLSTESSVVLPAQPKPFATAPGIVEMRNAEFAYPGAEFPVLCGVNFTAEPGKVTAVIGGTGSGKSTLINLVPRLIDVTAGQVLVGGTDIRDLDIDALRQEIGLIPQKPFLFSGTIGSNLRYGKADATDDELWEALEIAQGADFVRKMPEGLETEVSQGGTTVSGGQRQRLAIARALVRKPSIYLFDDSFSALDLTTDSKLRAALKPVMKDACMIVVAQRVSTIIDADQILVLDDGQPVGLGTHDELIATCPTYAEIVDSQHAVAAS
ncbi:ABC transporter ATP-binding protein [Rhodococcus sp. RS1C4]|uniref:ABC transporter ATP-binding protein n=1 Tax=Nocardiaceae TaxID=85025 RepID=UPI00035CA63B|nr:MULTISPECIES: ABC transporter ATP-binding protein [Rhodococcus]OZC46698.1 ABC transporter ATP-binding protein [Rhodococcus sp. 06-621-2]OZC52847.1 ABC transporter ATP-binding protein [Rhodococcus sp. RS1C4]OZC77383.1 ABC transporter ATP-binding protein [Rhodococcus sp. 06-418-1B]OZC77805.1 ABC transporter ATP-binding protein [Rhodococcus sp. 06-418-1B]OZD14806.1 ABC transporter ATP-binding protein [Rhodococcus sp. 06-156-4C]